MTDRIQKTIITGLLMILVLAVRVPAETEDTDPAEWTVMMYFCGSDLESRHSCATGNLEEIVGCMTYDALRHVMRSDPIDPMAGRIPVNVLLETGGCKEWHAQELGMDISTDRLERWHLKPMSRFRLEEKGSFVKDSELPLQSMAAPETLTDFIRWSVQNYPAKKYMLVLWDHGGGSKTGIFIDELFDNDIMYLDELHDALSEAEVHFEAILFDACLMANLETAGAVKDYADWMIASEEVVAGNGTAMGEWLQQLYLSPQWDGKTLGRWISDMTQIKYANEKSQQAQDILTWSVIDLNKISRVEDMFDRFFEEIGIWYSTNPAAMMGSADFLSRAFEFGLHDMGMIDLTEIFYMNVIAGILDPEIYFGMLEALQEAIVYTTRGGSRSGAGGLSFCYAAPFSAEELEVYSRNARSPHYLAFLDAITPAWTAPDWVYEKADHLPDIREIDSYQIKIEKHQAPDGTPGVTIEGGHRLVNRIYGTLYQKNEQSGKILRLGTAAAEVDMEGEVPDESGNDIIVYALNRFWMWPAIEGIHCDAEVVDYIYSGSALYNIPVRIGTDICLLRCGFDESEDEPFTVYGVWEGYDADSNVFSRNVKALSGLAGQDFCLLYPVDGTEETGQTLYESSEIMPMYRSLEITAEPLPAGTYYIDYWVEDIFMRLLPVGRAELCLDGQTVSLTSPDDWQGSMIVTLPES